MVICFRKDADKRKCYSKFSKEPNRKGANEQTERTEDLKGLKARDEIRSIN